MAMGVADASGYCKDLHYLGRGLPTVGHNQHHGTSAHPNRKRPNQLSITYKLSTDDRSQFDVDQTSKPSPDHFIAGRWVMGASQIAAESSKFDQIGVERFLGAASSRLVSDQRIQIGTVPIL